MILQQTELFWSCWEESQISQIQNQYEPVNQHQAIAIRKNMEDLYTVSTTYLYPQLPRIHRHQQKNEGNFRLCYRRQGHAVGRGMQNWSNTAKCGQLFSNILK